MVGPLLFATLMQVPAPTQEILTAPSYDESIPTLEEEVTDSERKSLIRMRLPPTSALADAAPDRTRLIQAPKAGRDDHSTVSHRVPERIANLEGVKADLARFSAVKGLSNAEIEELIAKLPVVTALMHGIHGNEITPNGAAMAEAYHLLAAEGDATVDMILRESLVLIDPTENPDGRARFVQHTTMSRARWPNQETYSAEHDEPWPGGRGNHYLFDLNRDLFIQSQPRQRERSTC